MDPIYTNVNQRSFARISKHKKSSIGGGGGSDETMNDQSNVSKVKVFYRISDDNDNLSIVGSTVIDELTTRTFKELVEVLNDENMLLETSRANIVIYESLSSFRTKTWLLEDDQLGLYLSKNAYSKPFIVKVESFATTTNPPAPQISDVDDINEYTYDDYEIDDEELIRFWKNDKEIMIAKQKERAMAHWREAVKSNEKLVTMNASIVEQLEKGLVPPAFHAFSTSESNYLFPVGTRVSNRDINSDEITLSANPVKSGISKIKKKKARVYGEGRMKLYNSFVHKISREKDVSYISSFFDKSGKAYCDVYDDAMNSCWEFTETYANAVTNLVNTPSIMVGEDVEVTILSKSFPCTHGNKNLITRTFSRGVVADCFHKSEPESTYAITGNTGIGKTWNLFYALQQSLLYENSCVLFFFQNSRRAILCIRRKDTIYVWQTSTGSCISRLFENSNVLVLLDPSERGASFLMGRRRLLYAAENFSYHFQHNIEKVTASFSRFLSPYKDKELVVAVPYMLKDTDNCEETFMKDILQRRKIVGNLPRLLIAFARQEERRVVRPFDVQKDQLRYFFNYFNGIIDQKKETYDAIQSICFNIWAWSSSSENGYDGNDNVKYGKREVRVSSQYVKDGVIHNYRDILRDYIGKNLPPNLNARGVRFQELFWSDLVAGRTMRSYKLIPGSKVSVQTLHHQRVDEYQYKSECCTVMDLKENTFPLSNVLCRINDNVAIIDVAGPGRKVYHVTVSRKMHFTAKSVNGLTNLFLASGHLVKDAENNLLLSIDKVPKLDFYWVIPCEIEIDWMGQPPISWNVECMEYDSRIAILNEILVKYVDQYVLLMDSSQDQIRYRKRQLEVK